MPRQADRHRRISLLFDLFAVSNRVRVLLRQAMANAGLRPDEYAIYSAVFKVGPLTISELTCGVKALLDMTRRAREAVRSGKQLVIFPEGTRRAPGAEPDYKTGFAQIYSSCGVQCLPIALNSGLVWPRRSFLRYPGVVRVEILDPIPPGLPADAFFARLQQEIETETARVLAEGRESS